MLLCMNDPPPNPRQIPPVEFDLTIVDGREAVDFQLSKPETQRSFSIKIRNELFATLFVAFFGALALTGIPTWVRGYNDPTVWACTIVGATIAVPLTIAANWPGKTRTKLRETLLKQVQSSWVFGPKHIELRDEGVFTSSSVFRGIHPWGAITAAHRTKTAIYFTTIEKRTFGVPLRAFASESQIAEFFEYARASVERHRPVTPPIASSVQRV